MLLHHFIAIHDMRMHIKEITYQNDYIWKCSYNYLNFLNSHCEKIIFINVHYTIALHGTYGINSNQQYILTQILFNKTLRIKMILVCKRTLITLIRLTLLFCIYLQTLQI